jgi:hypothetical protein
LEQHGLGRRQILGFLRVRILAQVVEHRAHHLRRRIEHADAALGDLRGHRRIEHQAPAVERRIRHQLLDHLLVVADAVGAPHVDDAVSIVRIVLRHLGHELRIHVLEVRQLRLVERQIDAGLDLTLEIGGRGHDDVEAAAAREQLGLQRLVGIEIGDVHLDAGLLLEVGERCWARGNRTRCTG